LHDLSQILGNSKVANALLCIIMLSEEPFIAIK